MPTPNAIHTHSGTGSRACVSASASADFASTACAAPGDSVGPFAGLVSAGEPSFAGSAGGSVTPASLASGSCADQASRPFPLLLWRRDETPGLDQPGGVDLDLAAQSPTRYMIGQQRDDEQRRQQRDDQLLECRPFRDTFAGVGADGPEQAGQARCCLCVPAPRIHDGRSTRLSLSGSGGIRCGFHLASRMT